MLQLNCCKNGLYEDKVNMSICQPTVHIAITGRTQHVLSMHNKSKAGIIAGVVCQQVVLKMY